MLTFLPGQIRLDRPESWTDQTDHDRPDRAKPTIPLDYFDVKQKEWIEERDKLQAGLMMYRYKYEEMERKVKLLPAPVEVVTSKLKELEDSVAAEVSYREQMTTALYEREATVIRLQAELEAEKKKPWWKRIWK
jgi:hypothetical protein